MKPDGILVLTTHGAERLAIVRQLRYEVLRQPLGMPFEETLFAGDDLSPTQHWIAFADDQPIGCLTLMLGSTSDRDRLPDQGQHPDRGRHEVQLRGMAVLQQAQGRGIGSRMLDEVHRRASERSWHLWCNARQAAVSFYAKNGWRICGQPFDIPRIGIHFVMRWEPSA